MGRNLPCVHQAVGIDQLVRLIRDSHSTKPAKRFMNSIKKHVWCERNLICPHTHQRIECRPGFNPIVQLQRPITQEDIEIVKEMHLCFNYF